MLIKIKEIIIKEMMSQTVGGIFSILSNVACIESNNCLMNCVSLNVFVYGLFHCMHLTQTFVFSL